jgi:hypothetical protein
MKNTKNTKNTKKPEIKPEFKPEFVVVYTVVDDGNRGMGDMTMDYTMLLTRKELDNQIANRGTTWIKKLYKLGNEVKFLDPEYVEA